METIIQDIMLEMQDQLSITQLKKLQDVLISKLLNSTKGNSEINIQENVIDMFIAAKLIEGCSQRTLKFYQKSNEANS